MTSAFGSTGGIVPNSANNGKWLRTVGGAFVWAAIDHADVAGLGGAALLNVGTAAGTVAAGNDSRIAGAAPLAGPTFTGDPKAPTPTAGDNDTSLATTQFVTAAITAALGTAVPGTLTNGAILWNGSAWVNAYTQVDKWARSRHATVEISESIDAAANSNSFATDPATAYAALVPTIPGKVYAGVTMTTKGTQHVLGSGGTKALWVAVYDTLGTTLYKQSTNSTTRVLGVNSPEDFTFSSTWTCPANVYAAYVVFHCNPGTGGAPIQPTFGAGPAVTAGPIGDLTIGLYRRCAAATITSSGTAPASVAVTASTLGNMNNQIPYVVLHT